MQDSDPKYTTAEEFNQSVRNWSFSIKRKSIQNLTFKTKGNSRDWKKRNTPKLKSSIDDIYKEFKNEVVGVGFNFEKHGVFVHYGVGRGYIREGGIVKRGRKLNTEEKNKQRKRGYTKKETEQMRIAISGPINRKPVDWFDVEIRTGIGKLADIAQEYHGDKAMKRVLDTWDKLKIDKK